MNHFILDYDLNKSAQYHCDKHVVKIILEATQVACTTRNMAEMWSPYKSTHINHPICKWCRETIGNYIWMCKYGLALCREYTYRYDKEHKCESYLRAFITEVPYIDNDTTPFCKCMPEEYKVEDVVESYRNYYIRDKFKTIDCRWTKRDKPDWIYG